jgi:vacuolar-type H+-ATPase subunit F/Vma7
MMQPKKLKIAVIGNEDQAALMRLAGVDEYRVIEDDHNIGGKVREALREFEKDTSIGIILIPENWTDYVDDLIKYIEKRRTVTPVIVEIPPKFDTERKDIREFYKSYTKKLLGFAIEV